MASASSSKSSLSRTQTRTASLSSSRRPRPRSPPSMYVAYETPIAKPPKPLIKLDKKQKTKASNARAEPDPPNPFPTRSNALFPPPPAVVTEPPQRRPSVGSFLSLRRKKGPPPSVPDRNEFRSPVYDAHPIFLHEPNVHPTDDLEPIPRRSDKASRMLGKAPPLQTHVSPERGDFASSGSSGTFQLSPSSSSSLGDGSSVGGASFDDDCFTDNSHTQRESTLLSPMEFAAESRPISVAFTPEEQSDAASDIDGSASDNEPITPVAPLPSQHIRTEIHDPQHASRDSYASVHDYYSHSHSRGPSAHKPEYRPDTPFMDTLVAVNSQVLAARGPTHHSREPSVIRAEPKQGWMGEWNQEDMSDVIAKLRSL
ncbi:hypothetical protein B0H11DRAFT_2016207, partial [Mycena galericulata]